MSEQREIKISLHEAEWEYLLGEAHFFENEPEDLIKQLIKKDIIDRKIQEQTLFESDENKENYNNFVLALDYYLSVAVKEAIQLEDKKMEHILSILRDDYIQKDSLILKLFEIYNKK